MLGIILYSEGSGAVAQLPKETVVPSLEMLQARLDGALGSLGWGGQPCPWLGFQDLNSPPNQSTLLFPSHVNGGLAGAHRETV